MTGPDLSQVIADLQDPQASKRLAAVLALEDQPDLAPALLRTLEQLILHDRSQAVRQAALRVIGSPAGFQAYQGMAPFAEQARKIFLKEISHWAADGLLSPSQVEILNKRYAVAPAERPKAEPAPVPTPEKPVPSGKIPTTTKTSAPVSLSNILLNETTIKIALYLGAFLVVAAAFVLGSLVEVTRLPILILTILLFFGSALGLVRRLPLASFVLFLVATFMLPIFSGVLFSTLQVELPLSHLLWCLTLLFIGLVAASGTFIYKSRFFSILALLSFDVSLGFLTAWMHSDFHVFSLLSGLLALLAILASWLLRRWQGNRLFTPLFVLSQIQINGLLGASLLVAIAQLADQSIEPITWLVIAGLWLVAVICQVLSDWITADPLDEKLKFPLFPLLAVLALIPIPLYFSGVFVPVFWQVMTVAWGWALVLTLSGEGLAWIVTGRAKRYSYLLIGAGGALFIISTFGLWADGRPLTIGLLAGTWILYTLMNIRRARWPVWSGALAALGLAWFASFSLTSLADLDPLEIWVPLALSLIYLAVSLVSRYAFKARQRWWLPALVAGIMIGLGTLLQAQAVGFDAPAQTAVIYAAFAAVFVLYALLERLPLLLFGTLALSGVSLNFGLEALGISEKLPAFLVLTGLWYLVAGLTFRDRDRPRSWSRILGLGGLVLQHVALNWISSSGDGSLAFGAYAFFALVFALLVDRPVMIYLATLVGLPAALGFGLLHLDWSHWVLYFVGLTGIYYALNILLRRSERTQAWAAPLLWSAVILQHLTLLTGWTAGDGSLAFLAYAFFAWVYSVLRHRPAFGYGALIALPVSLGLALYYFEFDFWVLPYIGLALAYYLPGLLLVLSKRDTPWGGMLYQSGLMLALAVSLTVPFEGKIFSVIGIAIAAFLFTFEAFRRKNVWLGFPANLLYFLAYALALFKLDVSEPQFFTIFAALLGIIMHYLLLRREHITAALITGVLVQLILLSTTLVQMIATDRLVFFFVLFFQSLVLLVYGLVIRSRSFVIGPIVFVVLGVISAAFSVLSGLPIVLLTGCTGVLLLVMGVLALILRERLVAALHRLGDWNP
jgi:hypothetical protein